MQRDIFGLIREDFIRGLQVFPRLLNPPLFALPPILVNIRNEYIVEFLALGPISSKRDVVFPSTTLTRPSSIDKTAAPFNLEIKYTCFLRVLHSLLRK